MTTLILIFLGLVVVGLLIQVLGKAAGDEGAEQLGGALSGCGQAGCGCMVWIVIAVVALVILLLLSAGQSAR